MDNLDKILEGLLFLSGDGLDRGVIMEKLQVTPKQLDKAVEILKTRYNDDCGINMITYKDKLQLCASPKFADDVSAVLNPIRERQLTRATLEVMAIIAYKQPVTRIDVQDIRGINSDYAIQTLLNYKLIEVVGRKDAVGKPLLFGTTDEFLRHFGINNLDELPDYEELMKNVEQIKLENNHLYNEYEIPEEAKEDKQGSQNTESQFNENSDAKSEIKTAKQSDDILLENFEDLTFQNNRVNLEMEGTEKKSKFKQNIKANEAYFDKNKDISLEDIATQEIISKDDLDLEELANQNYVEFNQSNFTETTSKNNIDLQEENSSGIDWTLLEDNPDIDDE